jgi:hypothetical protein
MDAINPHLKATNTAPGQHLCALLLRWATDPDFRRLAIGSPTFGDMMAEAILEDRTGRSYQLAAHIVPAIDLVATDGHLVQVKTLGTRDSWASISPGQDGAHLIMVITTFGKRARFFLVPMERFKEIAKPYELPRFSWSLRGSRIANGALDAFEINPAA